VSLVLRLELVRISFHHTYAYLPTLPTSHPSLCILIHLTGVPLGSAVQTTTRGRGLFFLGFCILASLHVVHSSPTDSAVPIVRFTSDLSCRWATIDLIHPSANQHYFRCCTFLLSVCPSTLVCFLCHLSTTVVCEIYSLKGVCVHSCARDI